MKTLTTTTANERENGFLNAEMIEEENRIRNIDDNDPEIKEIYADLLDLLF